MMKWLFKDKVLKLKLAFIGDTILFAGFVFFGWHYFVS